MSGETGNARVWTDADVWIGKTMEALAPSAVDDVIGSDWLALGLLTEDGFATVSENGLSTDIFHYGGGITRQVNGKHKRTITVTAQEQNAIVWQLQNPGSTSSTTAGTTTATVKVPTKTTLIRPALIKLVDGEIIRLRYIPQLQIVTTGTQNQSDATTEDTQISGIVIPNSTDDLWVDISNDPALELTVANTFA